MTTDNAIILRNVHDVTECKHSVFSSNKIMTIILLWFNLQQSYQKLARENKTWIVIGQDLIKLCNYSIYDQRLWPSLFELIQWDLIHVSSTSHTKSSDVSLNVFIHSAPSPFEFT